ncbi:MAG: ABC transporter family substrate-binding protein [Pseudonocardia sp.]
MRPIKKSAALAATAVLSVVLAACGSGPVGPTVDPQPLSNAGQYNAQPYDNIKDGGTLTLPLRSEITAQFNLFHGDGTYDTRRVWNWYNPLLITFSPTGDALFNPDYLTDATEETAEGNTRITYTINPKATYNDGTPIDWRSFESTWKVNNATDPAYVVSASDGYDRITSVSPGTDDRQAVVTFSGINVWWPSLFNNLVHPAATSPEVFNTGYLNTPHPEWGAGPYTISKLDQQNGTISFERNPTWWGATGKLDTVTLIALEASASINAFKNGQTDAAEVNGADRLAQVKNMQGIDIRKSTTPATYLFQLNGKSPILSDPAVRKAVMEGVDRAQLGKILHQGLDYSEDPPGSLALLPFQDGHQDNFSQVITFDPEKAKADLEAAGWVAGPDGTRSKGGQPLTFDYVRAGDSPRTGAVATATAAMMKNIGVTMNIRQVASNEFSSILSGRTFDLFFSGFVQSDPYGLAYFCQLYCSNSELNVSGTGQAALDADVKSVNLLPTPQEQYAKANEVEVEAFKTYGVMPIENGPTIFAVKQGLANYGAGLFFIALPQNIGWQK